MRVSKITKAVSTLGTYGVVNSWTNIYGRWYYEVTILYFVKTKMTKILIKGPAYKSKLKAAEACLEALQRIFPKE